MRSLIFDIETGPLPDQQLFAIAPPFVEPDPPGEFDPSAVKVGNLKDAAKIAEKIEIARMAHDLQRRDHGAYVMRSKLEYEHGIRSKAALDAATGRVLAIGCMDASSGDQFVYHIGSEGSERDVIQRFWDIACPAKLVERPRMIGFFSSRFDVPFLVRRSWLLGIPVPDGIRAGRYIDPRWVDLIDEWQLGDRSASISMDRLCRALGVDGKNGDGALFYQTYETDRSAALEYLRNDLRMTYDVARALGVIPSGMPEPQILRQPVRYTDEPPARAQLTSMGVARFEPPPSQVAPVRAGSDDSSGDY